METKRQKGQIGIAVTVILLFLFIILVVSLVVPFSHSFDAQMSIKELVGLGYVVADSDEYMALVAQLDRIESKADAAVVKADAAVTAGNNAVDAAVLAATKVDLFNTAERFLYPSATNITCTLVAGNTNVFGNWTLVTDSAGGNLSSVFSVSTGYVVDMQIYDHSAVDKIYLIELAYGGNKTTLGRVAYHTSFTDNVDIKSVLVPAGETIYYRMMSSGANEATAKVGFRYIYE